MATVFIIHGSYGSPEENWIPWLKAELEKLNFQVFAPRFPTPKSQNLESWNHVFGNYKTHLSKDAILVGHSIGCAFILNLLEKYDVKVSMSFLVAGFIGKIGNDYYDVINKTFTERDFDWDKIKKNCGKFLIYHSHDDPYIPFLKAEELASELDCTLKIVDGAGHFNTKSGYNKFEILLQDIKKFT